MSSRIYLDNNSTTQLDPAVAEAMIAYTRLHAGNPASAHRTGALARTALESARAVVARCLGAHPDEVIFTSGATEANNLAILGLGGRPGVDVYYSMIEHPSVVEPCKILGQRGAMLHELEVDHQGYIRAESLPEVATGLVAIQLANHETGTVQNIKSLRQRCPQAFFHADATQAVGKIPIHFHDLAISTLSCSAHKFFGPPGIGVLLVNRCVRLQPRTFGGHQQAGMRPGTEPVMLAVGFARALQLALQAMNHRRDRCLQLRQVFLERLRTLVPDFIIHGDSETGMVHTLNLAFPGVPSDMLFIRLDLAGIDCSTGSACSSGSLLPSPVLQAMAVPPAVLKSSLRFSLSHLLSEEVVAEAAERVAQNVMALPRTGV